MSEDTFLFGRLVVVETERTAYLGTLELLPSGRVTVCTGLAGRRPVLALEEIVDVRDALSHPDVVVAGARRSKVGAR